MDTEFEFQLIFCISSLRNVKITLHLKVRLESARRCPGLEIVWKDWWNSAFRCTRSWHISERHRQHEQIVREDDAGRVCVQASSRALAHPRGRTECTLTVAAHMQCFQLQKPLWETKISVFIGHVEYPLPNTKISGCRNLSQAVLCHGLGTVQHPSCWLTVG